MRPPTWPTWQPGRVPHAAPAAQVADLLDRLVARRPPVDEREARSWQALREGLAHLGDPCSEHADPTHVTSSAIVVGPRGLLLHRHKRLGIWLQPGGHIDDGEDPATRRSGRCRRRPACTPSTSGGAPALVHVDVHPGPRGHTHLDLRFLLAADGDPTPPPGESPDVRWWPWPDAAALTSGEPGLAGIVRALMDAQTRTAAADDAPAVAEVYLRSFAWAYQGTEVALAHPPDDVRRWVREELLPGHDVQVAVAAGAVVGFAATTPGWLSHLYVDPSFAGTGLGGRLFDAATATLARPFDLWTFEVNARARRFYERRRMAAVEHGDGSGNEEGQPDVRYRMPGHMSPNSPDA